MATNFGLTTATPNVNVIQSINYLLSTQGSTTTANVNYNGNVLVANTVTGTITGVSSTGQAQTNTISYLYGYIDVAYANTATGGGFTSNCTNQQYFGVHNSQTPSFDTNPVDYQWTQVAGGFGTNKYLYYTTGGGNTINFSIGSAPPSIYYSPVIDSTPILLASLANSIVTTTSILPGAVVGNVIAGNTITGTNIQTATITGNLIAANTIVGNNIQAGTITANLLAAGVVVVSNSIQSNNATFGSTSSAGFWLDASTGNVRFGGNTSIGNSLTIGNNVTVGNNAIIGGFASIGTNVSIGGNLSVAGLITAGSLQANTVQTNNLSLQTVSLGSGASSSTSDVTTNPTANAIYYYSYAQPSIVTTVANEAVYVTANYSMIVNFAATTGKLYQMFGYVENVTTGVTSGIIQSWYYDTYNSGAINFAFNPTFTWYDIPNPTGTGTYGYRMAFVINPGGSSGVNSITFLSGNMVLQGLKR